MDAKALRDLPLYDLFALEQQIEEETLMIADPEKLAGLKLELELVQAELETRH